MEIGKKTNRLTLLRKESAYGIFHCDCGTEKRILTSNVAKGGTKSCGCYFKDQYNSNERIKTRFESYIEKSKTCWFWKGNKNVNGYGLFTLKGKYQGAHRASYQIYKGKIPDSLHVCHKCDNRDCVNPEHLWLGTHSDNMKDMWGKGRKSHKGGHHPKAKIPHRSELQIIQFLRNGGLSVKNIALSIGRSIKFVDQILKKTHWSMIKE